MLFDFSNRGGRGAFTRLNDGGGSDLAKESYAGNGFLNRRGYTVVCAGWQGDAAARRPEIRNHKPEEFVDTSFVSQMEKSGFIKKLYASLHLPLIQFIRR